MPKRNISTVYVGHIQLAVAGDRLAQPYTLTFHNRVSFKRYQQALKLGTLVVAKLSQVPR